MNKKNNNLVIETGIRSLNLENFNCDLNLENDNVNKKLINAIFIFLREQKNKFKKSKKNNNPLIDFDLLEQFSSYLQFTISDINTNNIDEILTSKTDHNIITLVAWYFYYNKNNNKCVEYFLKGVELGDDKSMLNLGNYYEHFEDDKQLAEKYFLLAAEKNNLNALAILGMRYRYEDNNILSEKYLLKAIELNSLDSFYTLINFYNEDLKYSKIKNLVKKYSNLVTPESISGLSKTLQINCLKIIDRNEEQEYYYKQLCKK